MESGTLVSFAAGVLACWVTVAVVVAWLPPVWAVFAGLVVAVLVMLGTAWVWDYTRERRTRGRR